MPNRGAQLLRIQRQEPNSALPATTWSPALRRPVSARCTAAMPEAVARQASAPSSSAMRSSNICHGRDCRSANRCSRDRCRRTAHRRSRRSRRRSSGSGRAPRPSRRSGERVVPPRTRRVATSQSFGSSVMERRHRPRERAGVKPPVSPPARHCEPRSSLTQAGGSVDGEREGEPRRRGRARWGDSLARRSPIVAHRSLTLLACDTSPLRGGRATRSCAYSDLRVHPCRTSRPRRRRPIAQTAGILPCQSIEALIDAGRDHLRPPRSSPTRCSRPAST